MIFLGRYNICAMKISIIAFVMLVLIVASDQYCNFYYQGMRFADYPMQLNITSPDHFIVVPTSLELSGEYCDYLKYHPEYASGSYSRLLNVNESVAIYSVSNATCFGPIEINTAPIFVGGNGTEPQPGGNNNNGTICECPIIVQPEPSHSVVPAESSGGDDEGGGNVDPPVIVCQPKVQYIRCDSNSWNIQVTIIPDVRVVSATVNYTATDKSLQVGVLNKLSDSRWSTPSVKKAIKRVNNVTIYTSDGATHQLPIYDAPDSDVTIVPEVEAFLLKGVSNSYYVLFQLTPDFEITKAEYTYYSTLGNRVTVEIKSGGGWANHWAANIPSNNPVNMADINSVVRVYKNGGRVSDLMISFVKPYTTCPPIPVSDYSARTSSCVFDSCGVYTNPNSTRTAESILGEIKRSGYIFDSIILSIVVIVLVPMVLVNMILTILMRYKKNIFVYNPSNPAS
jgi:hypothetical protein